MSDELALLARVSFTGTAMMAPIVLMAVISKGKPSKGIIVISAVAFIIHLLSLAHLVPDAIGGIRLDLLLYLFLVIATLLIVLMKKRVQRV
jgi:SSS family solute:Na+ symporter